MWFYSGIKGAVAFRSDDRLQSYLRNSSRDTSSFLVTEGVSNVTNCLPAVDIRSQPIAVSAGSVLSLYVASHMSP